MKVIPIGVVQNADRAISARDYENSGDKILVTSVFRTIQGEGPLVGRPAVFIRLSGCNYGDKTNHCDWCDTSFHFDRGVWYEPEDLLTTVRALRGYRQNDVLVITGGEPTLQLNLIKFIQLAWPYFDEVQIESNGTQPKFVMALNDSVNKPILVVSPKAGPSGYGKIPDACLDYVEWVENSCLKFVLSADPNSPHHNVPDQFLQLGLVVYVSPMTVYARAYAGEVSSIWDSDLIDKEATAKNYAYAAEYALKHNLRISVQMHTFLGIA